ncbi:MAG: type II toxin-antitoxin system RelE/ParE family toxin [Bacteroidales bacterium]|nr:type II toxin-antitoxin system RelE/ParE family toxin [Bacteroidales bacterium]
MNEAELVVFDQSDHCTVYSLKFTSEEESEIERFYSKFKESSEYNEDFERIISVLMSMLDKGALERLFRYEGKWSDRVCALPVYRSKLRLYCVRISDKIIVLGNGGVKKTQKYQEDDELRGYVVTLQTFDRLLKEGVANGSITVTENTIETDKTFKL